MHHDAGRRSISPSELRQLYRHDWRHNLVKIPFFYALLVATGMVAWHASSAWVEWSAYVFMGYLWMGILTFMHDATKIKSGMWDIIDDTNNNIGRVLVTTVIVA